MKRFLSWLKNLFFPPPHSTPLRRVLPFAIVALILILVFLSSLIVWEETNTTVFCGTACHTMPPQYVTHQVSSHARLTCEDCHMGRAPIFESIRRKVYYSWLTGSAMVFNTYEYPIYAKKMRPASDACEPCHSPELFTDDRLVEIKRFAADESNSPSLIYLILKTGGGTRRQGLGYGIHWHIENPVYYYATDEQRQTIPYVRVTKTDGSQVEYVDVESGFDPKTLDESELVKMDCITCHNRTAHNILSPEDAVNQFMARNLVSSDIPEIRKKAYEVLNAAYTSQEEAQAGIAALADYYKTDHPDYYAGNIQRIDNAVLTLQRYYRDSFFFDQKMNWTTHPNDVGHKDAPGCFRCHDGKHLSPAGEAVRLECNLCHSIPVVSSSTQLVASIPVSKGVEPSSHKNSNWIMLHREVFDDTCVTCHTVEDPGGSSNTSFCSNSACHGQSWPNAGFDAPQLREALKDQLPQVAPTEAPPAEPVAPSGAGGKLLFADVEPLFKSKCAACHSAGGSAGLDLTSYAGVMQGSANGPVVLPGDSQASLLVQRQSGSTPHYGQFTPEQLAQVGQWIQDGALEK